MKRLFRILLIFACVLSFASFTLPQQAVAISYEDFTTWIEVDSGGDITVTNDTVSWDTELRNAVSYVYKDEGVGYFNSSFEILFKTSWSLSTVGDDGVAYWSLANEIGTWRAIYIVGTGDFIGLTEEHPTSPNEVRWYLKEQANEIQYTSSAYFVPAVSTDYYLRVVRDETVGTYGRLTLYIYSDSARTNLVSDNLYIDLHTKTDFRYVYAHQSYGTSGAYSFSGSTEDMSITLMSGIGFVPVVFTGEGTQCYNPSGIGLIGFGSIDNGALTSASFAFGEQSGVYTDNFTATSIWINVFYYIVPSDNLTVGQTYYFKAYASNDYGTGVGSEQSFVWQPTLFSVTTSTAYVQQSTIGKSWASFDVIVSPETANVTDVSAWLSTSDNGSNPEPLSLSFATRNVWAYTSYNGTNYQYATLLPATTYYYQGKGKINNEWYYSDIKAFTTLGTTAIIPMPSVNIVSIKDLGNNGEYKFEFKAKIETTANSTSMIPSRGVQFSLSSYGNSLLPTVYSYQDFGELASDRTYSMTLDFANATWYNGEKLYWQAWIFDTYYGKIFSNLVDITPTTDDGSGVSSSGGDSLNNLINWFKSSLGLTGVMGTWASLAALLLLVSLIFGVAMVSTKEGRNIIGIVWLIVCIACVGAYLFSGQLGVWTVVIIVGGVVGLLMIVVGGRLSGGGNI